MQDGAAGDDQSHKIYARLGEAHKREFTTLVPTASYLHDLHAYAAEQQSAALAVYDALRDVVHRGGPGASIDGAEVLGALQPLVAGAHAITQQAAAVSAHVRERIDELEVYSTDRVRAHVFAPLYGNERSQSGAHSELGESLQASHLSRQHSAIITASARLAIQPLLPSRPAPSTTHGAAREAAAKIRTRGTRGVGGGSGGGGGGGGGDGGGRGAQLDGHAQRGGGGRSVTRSRGAARGAPAAGESAARRGRGQSQMDGGGGGHSGGAAAE